MRRQWPNSNFKYFENGQNIKKVRLPPDKVKLNLNITLLQGPSIAQPLVRFAAAQVFGKALTTLAKN